MSWSAVNANVAKMNDTMIFKMRGISRILSWEVLITQFRADSSFWDEEPARWLVRLTCGDLCEIVRRVRRRRHQARGALAWQARAFEECSSPLVFERPQVPQGASPSERRLTVSKR